MKNPIIRQVKLGELRQLNLSISLPNDLLPSADCEVTELDGDEGWKRWQDSIFVRDFEESVLSEPTPLDDDLTPSEK
jgi:hypothetical protein